ncbi:hypothetical protein [Psychromonas hadalis]|uniref:hypothetical protein n=1 Tax=Psychromonas hadalis TaxID=211669 RepID=UPI0003B46D38|nr:hypothetical protein [Psychromonas hadalis]
MKFRGAPEDMKRKVVHQTGTSGPVEIIHYTNSTDVSVMFQQTQNIQTFTSSCIRKGAIKDSKEFAKKLSLFSSSQQKLSDCNAFSVPDDLIAGNLHNSKRYGAFEIIEHVNRKLINIKFSNTGFRCNTTASLIRSGDIRDESVTLHNMVAGNYYPTESCGIVEVINFVSANSVSVIFLDSSNQQSFSATNIRKGWIVDNGINLNLSERTE